MGQKRIAAVEDVRDGVELMLPQADLRVDAAEGNVPPVVLAGPRGVEYLIVFLHQLRTTVRVAPNPIPERVLDRLLLLLGKRGFLRVEHALFLSVRVLLCVIDAHVAQIQRVLKDFIGVGSLRSVGHVGVYVIVGTGAFAGDVPLRGVFGVIDLNPALEVIRNLKGFLHKLLDIPLVNPGCAEAHLDFRCVKVFRLRRTQGLRVYAVLVRELSRGLLRLPQLLPHVAGQIFVGCNITRFSLAVYLTGHMENNAAQLLRNLFLAFAA